VSRQQTADPVLADAGRALDLGLLPSAIGMRANVIDHQLAGGFVVC